ncbi:hypothetical protein ASPZODRAFT_35422, partial [Penicilliopsis zonata CBS 506.65]
TTWQWTIGWVTPSTMVACFIVAFLLACAHVIFFHWLNGRKVEDTFSQPHVNAASLVFANGFRMFLAAALGMAFIQMLWKLLRAQAMRVGDIDTLLSVLSNPLKLTHVHLMGQAPFLFLCAVVCWCLPIAMIFPPGAMTVEPHMFETVTHKSVPTFDAAYTGNDTILGMLANALWQPDMYDAYDGPTNEITRIARQAMMGSGYLTSSSPCGQNCSYSISFTAPSLECTNESTPDLFSWINETYPEMATYPYLYIAYPNYEARVSGELDFEFGMQFAQGGKTPYHNLSCVTYESTYKLNITYTDGTQTIDSDVDPIKRLNSSAIYTDYAIMVYNSTGYSMKNTTLNATTVMGTYGNVTDIYRRANLAAIQDALLESLSGYIDVYLLHNQLSANTIISLTDLYSGTVSAPYFDLSQATLQGMLQNITLSLLTLNQTTTNTTVTETTTSNVYSFERPARLLAPYVLSLAVSLAFLIGGGHALVSNGISASTGGLLQTLCTTRGSTRLSDLAARGSLGGRENVPEELCNLKVMFGELRGSRGPRMAGLGTEEEVVPLVRG